MPTTKPAPEFDSDQVASVFNQAAASYDEAAVVPREIETRLLEKLDYVELEPELIIDAGAGTGNAAAQLATRFPNAKLQLVDIAPAMLAAAKQRLLADCDRCEFVQANAQSLPLPDRSADLIFSNLMLPWCANVPAVLDEFRRLLKPGGVVLFSTLGPDTLYELRASWQRASRGVQVNTLADMHLVGDELLRAGFADPVMDVERLTVTYATVYQLMRELKQLGAKNIDHGRRRSLMGKRRWQRLVDVYQENFSENNRIWASYEVIYGYAIGPKDGQPRRSQDGMIAEFSVDELRGSRRGND